MDLKQITPAINTYLKRIIPIVQPEEVLLFGSYAREQATRDSDVDILVVAPFDNVSKDDRFDILMDQARGIRPDFHVYGMTPREYKIANHRTIIGTIKKEGKKLYSRKNNVNQ